MIAEADTKSVKLSKDYQIELYSYDIDVIYLIITRCHSVCVPNRLNITVV